MPLIIKTLEIAADTPGEIWKADRAVQSLVGMSRGQTVGLFDHQCVTVNGQPCTDPWRRLALGDTIELRYQAGQRYSPKKRAPQAVGFTVLYEDDHVIVVNKPADCLTTPTAAREQNTLIHRVAQHLTEHNRRRRVNVMAVQRLDRGVSGVLVLAKSSQAFAGLERQFAAHQPIREYVAIVAGRLASSTGEFRSYLTTSPSLKRYSIADATRGELAITHYRVETRLPNATVVKVQLETGRRNQIRVHFAEAGHPVLGDRRYEPERAKHPRWKARRLALHAALLAFAHPLTSEPLRFEAELPVEFEQFVAARAKRK